ncbi:ribulose-phosphate 3-epimerase, partial [Candidatus Woesearchaeota archaeon]|nr:ribulose-phosphate 3-epimerase [Candidatus Woesearchaeota archaeon]
MAGVGVSIMDADFGCLQKEVDRISNADFLHYDIGDAHFVSNLFGATQLVRDLKTDLKKMVHLMVDNPELLIEPYAQAGAHTIVIHLEATQQMDEVIKRIKKSKAKVGIALNPETKLHWL